MVQISLWPLQARPLRFPSTSNLAADQLEATTLPICHVLHLSECAQQVMALNLSHSLADVARRWGPLGERSHMRLTHSEMMPRPRASSLARELAMRQPNNKRPNATTTKLNVARSAIRSRRRDVDRLRVRLIRLESPERRWSLSSVCKALREPDKNERYNETKTCLARADKPQDLLRASVSLNIPALGIGPAERRQR